METTTRLVRTWMASGREQDISGIVAGISAGEATLIDVVKALGEYLTSEEDELRTKGVELLSAVIARCPEDGFNRQSVKTLTAFYIGKLEDTETIVPALKGLLPLSKLSPFTSSEAVDVVNALFTHVKMRALVQSVRLNVFSIVDSLMSNHRDALKSMGSDFLSGYIRLADGEKDPRNLMVAFAIARVIGIEFDIATHAEALFDIVFCYFPISFRPPPDDPYGITADDLRKTLRSVLISTPLFAPMALPLFVEKLSAGSPATKRDTLHTLVAAFPVYGAAAVHTHAKTFWDWLRLEIFQPSDEQTAEDAIQAAKALVSLLDPVSGSSSILVPTSTASHVHAHDHEHDHEHDHDHKHDHDHSDAHVHGPAQSTASDISPSTHMELQSTKSNLSDITTSIISECLSLLSHPEKSQATYATQVLAAFLSGTTRIASETLAQGVPHLLKIFRDPDEISNRGSALLHLARLADAARESSLVAQTQQTTNASNKDPLLGPYKDEVLGAFTSGLKTDSPGTASPALEGLKALVQTPRLLSDEEVGYVVHSVNELLQYFFALPPSSSSTSSVSTPTPPSEETSDGTLSLLLSISSSPAPSWARHVEMQTLPLLFAGLPDEPVHRDDETRRQSVWRTLEFLGKLCVHPGLFNVLVVRMLAKVDLLVAHLPSHDSSSPMAEPGADSREQEHQEAGVAYAHACLHTLATVLEKKVGAKDVDVERHVHKLVPQLFGLFIASALETHAPVSVVASAKGKGKAQAQSIANQPRLVDVAGRIVTLVLRGTSAAKQEQLLKVVFPAFLDGQVTELVEARKLAEGAPKFQPLRPGAAGVQQALVPLLASAIVPLHKETMLPVSDLATFLQDVLWWSVEFAASETRRMAAYDIVGSIVNKHADELDSFLGTTMTAFWDERIASGTMHNYGRHHAIDAWAHLVKALVVRNHKRALKLVDTFFVLFEGDPDVDAAAAKALGEVPAPGGVLTKANGAVIRMLYAQKYCVSLLPRLMEGARFSADLSRQRPHLIALTSLLKSVPHTVYADQMPALMPLLLRGLELPEPEIRTSIIDTLYASASGGGSSQETVSEHVSTLVAAMLKNAYVAVTPSPRVRIAALRYLGLIPTVVPYSAIHPQRAMVLKELLRVLDDPKKAIRKEAVDARSIWYTSSG